MGGRADCQAAPISLRWLRYREMLLQRKLQHRSSGIWRGSGSDERSQVKTVRCDNNDITASLEPGTCAQCR
jgi:hypothetical protein